MGSAAIEEAGKATLSRKDLQRPTFFNKNARLGCGAGDCINGRISPQKSLRREEGMVIRLLVSPLPSSLFNSQQELLLGQEAF